MKYTSGQAVSRALALLFFSLYVVFPVRAQNVFDKWEEGLVRLAKGGRSEVTVGNIATDGSVNAAALLIDFYTDGLLSPRGGAHRILSLEFVRRILSDEENPYAAYERGAAMQMGLFGFSEEKTKGKKVVDACLGKLKAIADAPKGGGDACYLLSVIYASEQANEKTDVSQALKWATRGHAKGNPFASLRMVNLALMQGNQKEVDEGLEITRGAPSDILERFYLEALLTAGPDDFEFDPGETGFVRKERGAARPLYGVCALVHKALKAKLVIEYSIKSVAPLELDKLISTTISDRFQSPVVRYTWFETIGVGGSASEEVRQDPEDYYLFMGLEKARELELKARELQLGTAFEKRIERYSDNARTVFLWDGLLHGSVNGVSVSKANMMYNLYSKFDGGQAEQNELKGVKPIASLCRNKLSKMLEK